MIIKLYKNFSDPRKVDKSIGSEITIDATLKGECSITHPQFLIQRGQHGFFNGYNYMYAPELGRYYYIDNLAFVVGNYVVIDTSVDVLMSFRNQIRAINCMVERNEVMYNPYLMDNMISFLQGGIVDVDDVGKVGDDSTHIYLTAIGAVEEEG